FSLIINSSDRLIIRQLLGAAAVGVYSAAYQLAQYTVMMVLLSVHSAGYPLLLRAFERGGRLKAREQAYRNVSLLLAVGVPAAAGVSLLTTNLAYLFMGELFRDSAHLILP